MMPLRRSISSERRWITRSFIVLREEAKRAATVVLRLIESEVGAPDQLMRGRGVCRRHRDAHRKPDIDLRTLPSHRRDDGCQQALAQRHRVVLGEVRDRDHEFVAADPRDDVAIADHAAQASRDLGENIVTRTVAEGIVDRLEADRGRA